MKILLELEKLFAHRYVQMAIPYLKQKYAIASIIFVVWIALIDSNNFFDQFEAMQNINQLKETREYYQNKVKIDTYMLDELKTSDKVLERYARENYLMKREGEDIFIIEPQND